jgi:hypothetical protein
MVWITRLARWNIRVWNKTISCGSVFQSTLFSRYGWVVYHSYCFLKCLYVAAMPTDHSNCWPMSSQKILKKICALQNMKPELHILLFFVMSYFLLFALWWNLMPKILSIAHSYCFLTCLYVVAIYMQTDHGIADQCQAKKYLKNICFIRPTYPTFFRIWNLNRIFFVMFKIYQKNADKYTNTFIIMSHILLGLGASFSLVT